jgi:hypothetical protein
LFIELDVPVGLPYPTLTLLHTTTLLLPKAAIQKIASYLSASQSGEVP